MSILKRLFKGLLYVLLIPVIYMIVAIVCSLIPVNNQTVLNKSSAPSLYLSSNGVHLDIVLPITNISNQVLDGLNYSPSAKYLSFGWGDENFYINTPNWSDLTFKNAFSAMFLKSTTLMHVTESSHKRTGWIKIEIEEEALEKLNAFLLASFQLNENQGKTILPGKGYSTNDHFYKANGSYSCIKTCNSWVNSAFKASGLKACLWTPFDFGLLNKYD